MITEKYKDFVEKVAFQTIQFLGLYKLDGEDYKQGFHMEQTKKIFERLNALGVKIKKSENDLNYTCGDTIYLSFDNSENCLQLYENRKRLFHEIWHFISYKLLLKISEESDDGVHDSDEVSKTPLNGYADKSISPNEILANYFARAMIFPEKEFVEIFMEHLDIDGTCDIYKVANIFSADYTDVIARAKDLNLWSTKVE